jgi:FixJ family two-component response regulator
MCLPTPAPRIFVVDDEHVIASTLAVIFNMNGYSARCFTRPTEALTAAQSDIPDLLISDVAMPGLSGSILLSKSERDIPIAKYCSFQDRQPPKIYSTTPAIGAMTSICF